MREIKFRAWDKNDKRMIVHSQDFIPLKVTSIGVLRLSPTHNEPFYQLMDNSRFELMQFTGLLDRNGKDIYEGDIVKYYNRTGVVRFNKGQFEIYSDYDGEHFSLFSIYKEEKEVIGNIYQNKELKP